MSNPVTIRGVEYRSMKEAAIVLGVSISAISQAAKRGRLDNAGTGKGAGKPCTIGGVLYGSRVDAAKALGVTADEVRTYLKVLRVVEALEGQ